MTLGNESRWIGLCLAAMALAGCNTTPAIDAAAETRDAFSAEDAGPATDAPSTGDAAPIGLCPDVSGVYTWLSTPTPTCDVTTSKSVYDIRVMQTGCTVMLESIDNGDNRWPLLATVTIDETGAFTGATIHIATSDTTCNGTYVAASGVDPARYDVVCEAGCEWSIRYGE